MPRAKTAPLPKLRERVKELDRREGERRQPKSLFAKVKRWLNRRWQNSRRWLRAIFDATAMAMGAFSFWSSYGAKVFASMLIAGVFLAPIEDD